MTEPVPAPVPEKTDEGTSSSGKGKKGTHAKERAQKKAAAAASTLTGKGKEKEKKEWSYQAESTYEEEDEFAHLPTFQEQQIMETTSCKDLAIIRNLLQANSGNVEAVIGVLLDDKGPQFGALSSDDKAVVVEKGAVGAVAAPPPLEEDGFQYVEYYDEDPGGPPRVSTSSMDTQLSTGTGKTSAEPASDAATSTLGSETSKKKEKQLSSRER